MWNFLKKMRYVRFDRCELYWKFLLATNWSWWNYTELYVRDRNLVSYSYIFGLIHVYSHSVRSSSPRAKGAVVSWCWKERLRRKIFDSWSSVLLFWFDTVITNIFLSFVDIRDVVHFHIHVHIHGLASFSLPSPGVRWAVLEPFTLHKIYPERIRMEGFENLLRNLTKIDNKSDTLQSA